MKNIGFAYPSERIKHLIHEIRNEYNRIYVLGYSVGATTAWLCSEEKCDGVIGYYGSRIKNKIRQQGYKIW